MRLHQLRTIYFFIFAILSLQLNAQIIPDSLRADWSHAGYTGTIPSPSLIINVKDFGAYGDSIHNDYNAIVNAINSSSNLRVIFFPAGNYLIGSSISLPSNVVLRGEGSNKTNLCFNLSNGDCIDISGTQTNAFVNINSGYFKGSNLLNISNASAFKTGSYAEIHETNGSWNVVSANWATYSVGQIVKIDSVKNKTITIEPALRIDYVQSLQPQIQVITPVQNAGIECLKISRIDSTINTSGNNIKFLYAENCWVTGVESNKSQASHILIDASGHITVSGCYFHEAFTYDGTNTAGYGVTLVQHTSDCKIENSIFRHLRHSMVAKQGANGNVFAYNYSFDPNRTEIPNDAGADLLLHGHYAFANLFEGNLAQTIIIDEVWGPSGPYNTFFRNRASLYGIAIIDTSVSSDRENYVGNEVTGSGTDSGYPLGNYVLPGNTHFTYGNNIRDTIQPAGTNVLNDSSYYLKSKPYFWNIASSWPSIGIPDTINTGSNPAKERYLSEGDFTSCIKESGTLNVIATTDSIRCNGNAATIYVTASGGTEPYQYSIDGINFQSQNSFLKNAGAYTITVTDANADTAITSISLKQPLLLKASLKKVNVTCNGDSSGSITVTASGGVKPYQFKLNTGIYQSSNVFNNLKTGTYNVSVKDSGNCILNIPSTGITQPPVITISIVKTDISCKNAKDGSITVNANKGTTPYQFSLNGGGYQSSNIFSGLITGTYMVEVKDAKGCTASKSAIKIKNSSQACNSFAVSKRINTFDVTLFPNPTVSAFNVTINSSSTASVQIKLMDVYGREIYKTAGTSKQLFDLGNQLTPGTYFIEIIQGENVKMLKIIKQ